MELKHVIIAHKARNQQAQSWADRCAKELQKLGCDVLVGPSGIRDNPYPVFLASVNQAIDLCLVFGGDGAVLAAARHLAPEGVPILAVNVGGHLGFLTEPFELFQETGVVWQRLLDDRYAVQRRMMLEARVFEGPRPNAEVISDRFFCLNEMCIKPNCSDRMPTSIIEMEVDGEVVDQYQGDGLLVATPTGSTCYVASAGGSIIHPGMEAITVTPICPLSLSSRTLILPPGCIVSAFPLGDYETNHRLWTDGAIATSLYPGQRVDVKMAECQAKFILLRENYSFYETLREKLQWAGARIKFNENSRN